MSLIRYLKMMRQKPKMIGEIDDAMDELNGTSKRMSRIIANARAISTEADVSEIIALAKEIRFLADDCIVRLARCRQSINENEFKTGAKFSNIAHGQTELIARKSKELRELSQNINIKKGNNK